jgi:hypothetical protein
MAGGWGGIRTHETVARLAVFKTAAFNHSATHPFRDSIGDQCAVRRSIARWPETAAAEAALAKWAPI